MYIVTNKSPKMFFISISIPGRSGVKDLNILTIDKIIIHRIGILMYKFSNGLLPTVLNSLYQKNNEVHTHNTRAKNMFHIFLGTQSFSSVSAKHWNALMAQIDVMFH